MSIVEYINDFQLWQSFAYLNIQDKFVELYCCGYPWTQKWRKEMKINKLEQITK